MKKTILALVFAFLSSAQASESYVYECDLLLLTVHGKTLVTSSAPVSGLIEVKETGDGLQSEDRLLFSDGTVSVTLQIGNFSGILELNAYVRSGREEVGSAQGMVKDLKAPQLLKVLGATYSVKAPAEEALRVECTLR